METLFRKGKRTPSNDPWLAMVATPWVLFSIFIFKDYSEDSFAFFSLLCGGFSAVIIIYKINVLIFLLKEKEEDDEPEKSGK